MSLKNNRIPCSLTDLSTLAANYDDDDDDDDIDNRRQRL